MDAQAVLAAAGAGVATVLLVGGVLTAVLEPAIRFSALVGLPVGLLAGLAAFVGIVLGLDRTDTLAGQLLGGYAAVGFAVIGYLALSYANVAGVGGTLGTTQLGIVAALVGAVVAGGLWTLDRRVSA